MSKQLLESLQQDRVNRLFNNLGSDNLELTLDQASGPVGWTWECDSEGNYSGCSPEIERILNIHVRDMLGKPISRFMLNSSSQLVLDQAFKNGSGTTEVDIEFLSADGFLVPARMYILRPNRHRDQGNAFGFRGFTNITRTNQQSPNHSTETLDNQKSSENSPSLDLSENYTQPMFEEFTNNLGIIHRLAVELASNPELDSIAKNIHYALSQIIEIRNFYIALHNQSEDRVTFQHVILDGNLVDQTHAGWAIWSTPQPCRSFVGQVIKSAASLQINSRAWQELSTRRLEPYEFEKDTLSSWLGLPIMLQGIAIGAIVFFNQANIGMLSEQEWQMLLTVSQQSAPAIQYSLSLKTQNERGEPSDQIVTLQKFGYITELGLDLRTSVNSIIGFSRVILKGIDGPLTDILGQDIRSIYHSGQQILSLTDELIDFSKIESGRMDLHLEENVNLVEIIASAVHATKGYFHEKQVEIVEEIEPDLPGIRVDPTKIRKILIRLFSLALKFTCKGMISISAKLKMGDSGDKQILIQVNFPEVVDIPFYLKEANVPFILSNTSTAPEITTNEVGFYTTQQLVKLHGGQMGASCQPDKSCTIYFTLPIHARQTRFPDGIDFKDLSEPNIINHSGKIMLIDDDSANINLIQDVFKNSHEQIIIHPSDLAKILEKVKSVKPDTIIIHPHKYKLETQNILFSLNEDPSLKSIPLVVLTSQILDEPIYHSINRSAIVLHKGFITEQDLRNVVAGTVASQTY